MTKILSVYNGLQAGDYENGNADKRRVSRLTQFIHATFQFVNFIQIAVYLRKAERKETETGPRLL